MSWWPHRRFHVWSLRELQWDRRQGETPKEIALTPQRILLMRVCKLTGNCDREVEGQGELSLVLTCKHLEASVWTILMTDIDEHAVSLHGFHRRRIASMRITRRELMENVRNLISAYIRISILFGKPPKKKRKRRYRACKALSCIRVSHTYRILFNFSIHWNFNRGSRRGAHRGFMSKQVKPQHTTLQMMLGWEKGWKKPPVTKTLLIRARTSAVMWFNWKLLGAIPTPFRTASSEWASSVQCLMTEINNETSRALNYN